MSTALQPNTADPPRHDAGIPRTGGATLAKMTNAESTPFPRLDFDALYRGESPAEGIPPVKTPLWDTKAPKETVVHWHQQNLVHGHVLDIGCGLGDNAIYLAQQGFTVTALDISPTALITAERRAQAGGVNVAFAVADATQLDGYRDAFDTIIDSGMFHCLNPADKRSYASAVHRATRAGATLLLSCFCEANPTATEHLLPVVSEHTLRDVLGGAGWDIASLEPTTARRKQDGNDIELAFWVIRAQRRG